MQSCDRNQARFRTTQLNQTTIEVDRLSSVSEIVVWLRETNKYYLVWALLHSKPRREQRAGTICVCFIMRPTLTIIMLLNFFNRFYA